MSATEDRGANTASVVPAEGFQYYRGRYWNDLDRVVRTLNERATGDPDLTWMEHLRDNYGPFRHALVLNCGNGWVERDLVAKGVVASAVGVDVSDELLDQARREAAVGRPAADLRPARHERRRIPRRGLRPRRQPRRDAPRRLRRSGDSPDLRAARARRRVRLVGLRRSAPQPVHRRAVGARVGANLELAPELRQDDALSAHADDARRRSDRGRALRAHRADDRALLPDRASRPAGRRDRATCS